MRKLLLCPPDFYGIEYEINPWMHRSQNADAELARAQWQGLRDKLERLGGEIALVPPQPKLPDMVFTANAGLLVDDKFIPSHFRHAERQGEEAHFAQWFAHRRCKIVPLPEGMFFEGEGDALFCGDVVFCGYRFRSDIRAHQFIADELKCLVVSVELVDGRFYHLDTCFCPLNDKLAMWFPAAFDDYGQRAIRHHIPELIEVVPHEAARFACNAVVLDRDVVLPDGCVELCRELTKHGFRPHELPMSEFIKAGGACKCLTLFLPQR
jgi:N-dimethylarginine dimethylaminohydrolase